MDNLRTSKGISLPTSSYVEAAQIPVSEKSCQQTSQDSKKWTLILPAAHGNSQPPEDGFQWWKCGQKQYPESRFPREYYCCAFAKMQQCKAKKQIQRYDEEPTRFKIKYKGDHSCRANKVISQICEILSELVNAKTKIYLLYFFLQRIGLETTKASTEVKRLRLTGILDKSQREHDRDNVSTVVVGNAYEEFELLPQNLKQLCLYCSLLFPESFEFKEDMIIQLWQASGFLETGEEVGSRCFSYLIRKKLIVASIFDSTPGNFNYKINYDLASYIRKKYSGGEYLVSQDGNLRGITERLQHLYVVCRDINEETVEALKRCHCLRTLLFFPERSYLIKEVPDTLFLSLKKSLCSLDLSGTNISDVPYTIGFITSLRYLDLSDTSIKRLPESLNKLHNLQTLKLNGCVHLSYLHSGIGSTMSLRHIYLDFSTNLHYLPIGMENLTTLETLSLFPVGVRNRNDRCSIRELRNLNNLRGKLRIKSIDKVLIWEEAMEATLSNKRGITKLELAWDNRWDVNMEHEEEVLRCLQPHFQLEELKIESYSGLKFPNWISSPSFAALVSIYISNCKNCQVFPSLSELPSLKILEVYYMKAVIEINCEVPTRSQRNYGFPSLEKLLIYELENLKEWTGVANGDFPNLHEVRLQSCSELTTIPLLSNLKSLNRLVLSYCPKLSFLLGDKFPASLEALEIFGCPTLRDLLVNNKDWDRLIHQIDGVCTDFKIDIWSGLEAMSIH